MCGRARCTLQRERVAQEAGVSCEQFINGDKCTCCCLRWLLYVCGRAHACVNAVSLPDNPVENMGPGRYTPVVYQAAPTRHDDGGEHHERRCSADKNAQRQKKLEAMRVRVVKSCGHVRVNCLMCEPLGWVPAVVGTDSVVHKAEREARPLRHVQRTVRASVGSAYDA